MKINATISNFNRSKSLFWILLFFYFQNNFAQPVYINEFMASNVTSNPEIIDFDDYSDWIELYNDSTEAVDLSGYGITDDLDNPFKWRLPNEVRIEAKGFLIVWADGFDAIPGGRIKYFHSNFKLSKDSEEIGLFAPLGELIDSVKFGSQISDVSYGRKPDGGELWYYFGESTQNESNITEGITEIEYSEIPEFSLESGLYDGQQSLTLSSAGGNGVVRYTTDGSRPTSKSNEYLTPIQIAKNVVVRARVFEYEKLPSKIITKSYFIDQKQTVPILSLTVFPETFFDSEIAIYDGEIKSREVPINVQYFEEGGNLGFELDAGVRLTGQWSFNYPQKSLTIEADDKFGAELINYPVFKDRPFTSYKSIYLRNSGTDDNQHTMFRDALQHTIIINKMDVDCQAYQPALTFINGEYWGIYNIREKLDDSYFEANHDINTDNMDYLEYEFSPEPIVVEGSTEDYYDLQNFLASNSMNIEKNWDYVKSQIDVNEVMNYLISEIFCDNVNWPNTNSKWWKENSEYGKWRYIFLDSDFGFGNIGWFSRVEHDMFLYLSQEMPPYSTFVFEKLMDNKDFENEFIQRFATYLNTVFKSERVLGIIDSIKNMIGQEMVTHIDRWNDYPGQIPSVAVWNQEVEIMRDFAERRPDIIRSQMINFFKLGGVEELKFIISENNGGYINVAGVKTKDKLEGEYFRYVPIKLEAVPSIGYKFVKWQGIPDSLSRKTTFSPSRSDSTIIVTAIFEEANVNVLSGNIIENTTLDVSGSPYYVKSDITINPNVTLTVNSGVEILMPSKTNLIIKGSVQMLGTEDEPIIIKPNDVSGFSDWGYMFFDSTSSMSNLKFVSLIGATQNEIDSSKIGAISSYKSDLTIENVTIEDAPFPIFTQFGNIIIRNSKLHSEEICDLINIKYAASALVEGCELRGNNVFDTDAIDYDQISNGIIRNNKIYNFYGFNSDGIDLGEGSKNILIEGNLVVNCDDKGISVGQASTTIIKKNVILSCGQGVGIKDDSSFAYIDRNTFQDCGYAVASFEKNLGAGGGNAEIVNSIISKPRTSPVFVDELSTLNISYSLCDSELLEGVNNKQGDPRFLNNYYLQTTSPAINSGNPLSDLDLDGTIADIGAKEYTDQTEPIIINEIHYNPNNGENYEFIELYNNGIESINISEYKVKGAINFNFPEGTTIGSKGFIVLAQNSQIYSTLESEVFDWGEESLPNNWGNISLFNRENKEVDFVSYSNNFLWPSVANGRGYSLELRNPKEENLVTIFWRASDYFGGSPGRSNKPDGTEKLFINEFQADNNRTLRDENGDYDDWIELYNGGDFPINLSSLYITDDFNNLTKYQIPASETENYTINAKDYYLLWADSDLDQGINHANFRLNDKGEEIALVYIFDSDTLFIDSISYGRQVSDFSFGRKDDGAEEWGEVKIPTPNKANSNNDVLKKGILLVNAFNFSADGVFNAYSNKAFWGDFSISFWDLLSEPVDGYPSTLPKPIGHGKVPNEVLAQYSTVIWTGENAAIELALWNASEVYDYVNMGGNLILLLKNGNEYLNEDFLNRMGLVWNQDQSTRIENCTSVFNGLNSISIQYSQFLSAHFKATFVNDESKLLFVDSEIDSTENGVGVWNKPKYGGMYKENGGQIVLISGRGYRYNSDDLKENIEYMLKEFFNEPKIISDTFDEKSLITQYYLHQNYPNPFNPSTVIKYDLLESEKVELRIYNVLGQEIRTLVNELQEKGNKRVTWNGLDNLNRKVSTGIYFYKITAGSWSEVKKMILMK